LLAAEGHAVLIRVHSWLFYTPYEMRHTPYDIRTTNNEL